MITDSDKSYSNLFTAYLYTSFLGFIQVFCKNSLQFPFPMVLYTHTL